MFKLKKLEIEVDHKYIVMLLEKDAKELGLKKGDRVKVFSSQDSSKQLVCDINIINNQGVKKKDQDINIKLGELGVYKDAFYKLGFKEGHSISLSPAPKPDSLKYVRKKFLGERLTESEFKEIVQDITLNKYTDIESTYFVLGCSAHPLNDEEVIGLTKAMVSVGKQLDFRTKDRKIVVDKHCVGGIPGNRTTMIVVPIIAAAGLTIPKTSSRAITSPAGTADTMEVLANVDLDITQMHKCVEHTGGCMVWGGALDLSPADDAIIYVEHPLEIDSEGQMIASIMSKKKSVGSTHVLIDIPYGKNAKVQDLKSAKRLKKRFEKVAKALGMIVEVLITDGSEPIGNGIGPLLESEDVLMVLKNSSECPIRLKEKSLLLAGKILEMGKICNSGKGYSRAKDILEFGLAHKKFEEIIEFQGRKKKTPRAKYILDIVANEGGIVREIHNKKIASLAFLLGAPKDKASGLYIRKNVGDKVKRGEILFSLYSNSNLKLKFAKIRVDEDSPYIIR